MFVTISEDRLILGFPSSAFGYLSKKYAPSSGLINYYFLKSVDYRSYSNVAPNFYLEIFLNFERQKFMILMNVYQPPSLNHSLNVESPGNGSLAFLNGLTLPW